MIIKRCTRFGRGGKVSPLHELATRLEHEAKLEYLLKLPEWKFLLVCSEGLLQEPHSGAELDGIYFSEMELHHAYFMRNPDAEPLY